MSLILTRESLSNQIADDLATRNLNKGLIESAVDGAVVRIDTAKSDIATLKGSDTTAGSVLKSIKEQSQKGDFIPAVGSGIASTILKDAVNEVGTDVEALKSDKADKTELSTVKVKTVENDLAIADIRRDQNLANQSEAKITVSDYGIVALPKNATGNLKMKREGLTSTNLVVNGNVESTVSSSLGRLKIKLDGTLEQQLDYQTTFQVFPIVSGNVYAVIINMTGNLRSVGNINLHYQDGTRQETISDTSTGQFAHIITANKTAHANLDIIGDGNPITKKEISLINLTQTFGAGNEPTADQCKNIFPTYFADTKNVPMTGRYRGTDLDGVTTHDLYFTAPEGRSVPSAKDSVEVQDGKLVHVKRVSDYQIVPTTGWVLSNTDGSTYTVCGLAGAITPTPRVTAIWIDTDTVLFNTTIASGTVGRIVYTGSGLFVVVPYITGTAQDAVTFFTNHEGTLKYQLETPITTPIDQDGAIPAGASVYWEPAIPDVGIYTDKFEILDTDHPIASIDKLYKVDFATGVQTQLTDAVVAGDGLSFTSASLTAGDLVNVIYFYSVANPEGLTTVTYLNSNVVSIDTVTGKAYTHKMKITNGVIQPLADWTITEVV